MFIISSIDVLIKHHVYVKSYSVQKKKWKARYLWAKADYVYFLETIEMKIREGFVRYWTCRVQKFYNKESKSILIIYIQLSARVEKKIKTKVAVLYREDI